MNTEAARQNMIRQQLRTWDVLDEGILNAVAITPREAFVPAAFRELAFADMAIPLGHAQCMLAPREEARLVQALQLQGTETVLEIGTGSGYTTALLAHLAKQVYSIDIFPDFTQQARLRLAEQQLSNVELITADAAHGWKQHGPYDAIIITGALPFLPESFCHSLKPAGRLIAILGQTPALAATLMTRAADGSWTKTVLFEMMTPLLLNATLPSAFVF